MSSDNSDVSSDDSDEELQPPNKKVKMSPTESDPFVSDGPTFNIFEHISDDVFLLNILSFCSFSDTLDFRLISKHVNSLVVSFFTSANCKLFVNVQASQSKGTFDLDQAANIKLKNIPDDEIVPFLKRFHNAKTLVCSEMHEMFFLLQVPFTRLQELHIANCSLDMLHFKAISEVQFEHLKILRLDGNKLRDEALQFLNKTSMPKLTCEL